MANRYKNLIYSTAEYTNSYQGFRGVELNGSNITSSTSRLSYSKNMYKDYEGDGADVLESIPGFRKILSLGGKVNGLYYHRCNDDVDSILVHVEDELYRCPIHSPNFENIEPEHIGYLANEKSFGIKYGRCFYILDSQCIYRVTEDGCLAVVNDDDATPYTPTMYVSGEKLEERNLLTDSFKEEYYVADPASYCVATDGLKYTITDPNLHYCAVAGIEAAKSGEVRIPSRVKIAEEEYSVTEIESYAFNGNTRITSVHIGEGVKKIGIFAFAKCTSLRLVATPDSLVEIGGAAFSDCTKLSHIYLGSGLEKMGVSVFATCTALTNIYYTLDEDAYNKIENISVLAGKTPTFTTKYLTVTLFFPMHEETREVNAVVVDDRISNYDPVYRDDNIIGVTVTFASLADATGVKVSIYGMLKEFYSEFDGNPISNGMGFTGHEAISACRTATVFDRRLFFADNPLYPNTVFYTEPHETGYDAQLYVGAYNYFNDGVGSEPVKSMLAVKDMLAVFKSADDGAGSIYYHSKENPNNEHVSSIYPVSYVHSGTSAVGASISFLDDAVFLSSGGLSALDRININYDRSVVCRSHNVNYSLLKEDLSQASLCNWMGYLAVCVKDKIFLADSRAHFTHNTGATEYEWFVLEGIGTFTNDRRVYRYAYDEIENAYVHPKKAGESTKNTDVYTAYTSDDELYYYTYEDGVKYHVNYTEEFEGGVFHPATHFTSSGNLLLFATENGDICVFNNDKRGIAPEYLIDSDDYDEEEYSAVMGNKIHPYFYSFAGHAPEYVIMTAHDNCNIPHLRKNTIKKSLVIKSKSYTPNSIMCEVKTDNCDIKLIGSIPGTASDFTDLNFSSDLWYPTRYSTHALNEKEKKWIEKQIILRSDAFASPISVYSITYRYSIQGRIKNDD